MSGSLLIVEDDPTLRVTLEGFLGRLGYRVASSGDGAGALARIAAERFDLILLDLRLPDGDGLELLGRVQERGCEALVVIITAFPEVRTAVSAIRAGAYDYLQKPFDLEELRALIARALETRRLRREVAWRRAQEDPCASEGLIGQSETFRNLLQVTRRVAGAGRTPVLIRGESGTGKEHVARAIHCWSERAEGPWIALNCSAMPEGLLESELFGFEKGAFTDARQGKRGLLELADGGTLFLDEIGDLATTLQPKLLRVLESQCFRRLGGEREVRVDVRFVAATHRDLEQRVRNGLFRQDLYYRLNVATVETPPLRDRRDDVLMLAEHFLDQVAPVVRVPRPPIGTAVKPMLLAYAWPGNVRELRNVMERAAIVSAGQPIAESHLPRELFGSRLGARQSGREESPVRTLAEVERDYITQVLEHCGGNKTRAAQLLGITRLTLRSKLGPANRAPPGSREPA